MLSLGGLIRQSNRNSSGGTDVPYATDRSGREVQVAKVRDLARSV